jgi:hypothetical protein
VINRVLLHVSKALAVFMYFKSFFSAYIGVGKTFVFSIFGPGLENPLACPMSKYRSKAGSVQVALSQVAVPLCKGGAGVRGFSRHVKEDLLS